MSHSNTDKILFMSTKDFVKQDQFLANIEVQTHRNPAQSTLNI